MASITAIKTYRNIQLAHLYEHLFVAALLDNLRVEGLFEYIDYLFEANTHHGGFVHIELLVRPDLLVTVNTILAKTHIDTSERRINICMAQVIAEKQQAASGDWQKLLADLKQLDSQAWVSLADLEVYDALAIKRTRKSFFLTAKSAPTLKLTTTFLLSPDFIKDNRQLIPLFLVTGKILTYSIRRALADQLGYYSYQDDMGTDSLGSRVINYYRLDQSMDTSFKNEVSFCKEALTKDLKDGLAQRIIAVLESSKQLMASTWIDEIELYKSCGILLGQLGWNKITTEQNLMRVLRNTQLDIQLSKHKQNIPLSELV